MRVVLPLMIALVASACQSPPQPVERPKRVATPGTATLPPTPNLNPPQAPEKYPDGAWSVRGLLAADKTKLAGDAAAVQVRATVASLHPCPVAEKVCKPAPYLELSDNKTGQGRRLLVAGERDLDARHWAVGSEITVVGKFATASPDGMYFAPDGLILLDPLPPPADADATAAQPDAK